MHDLAAASGDRDQLAAAHLEAAPVRQLRGGVLGRAFTVVMATRRVIAACDRWSGTRCRHAAADTQSAAIDDTAAMPSMTSPGVSASDEWCRASNAT